MGIVMPYMDDPAHRITHVLRGQAITWESVAAGLDSALQNGMRALVPPWCVERAAGYTPTVDIITSVSLPHGQDTTHVKCTAAEVAWQDGAAELEVVANLGVLRDDVDAFETDIAEVVAAVPLPVTIVIDATVLDASELRQAAEAAAVADADFLKLYTCCNGTINTDEIAIPSEQLPVTVGQTVESWATAASLFDAGVTRIATPTGDALLEDYRQSEE